MGWLFAQVWTLCAVAFLLGAAVTWVLFVVPARRAAAQAASASSEFRPATVWTAEPPAPPAPPPPSSPTATPIGAVPPASPAVDPALAALSREPRTPPAGTPTGALDLLGVGRAERTGPTIPAQGGPPEGEVADGSPGGEDTAR